MALVKQASKFPTRKIMAVILSGMIIGGAQALLKLFWPDHPFAPYMEDVDVWLQGLIMVLAGYMTKEKQVEHLEQIDSLQRTVDSGGGQLVFDFVRLDEKEAGKVRDGEQISQGQGDTFK